MRVGLRDRHRDRRAPARRWSSRPPGATWPRRCAGSAAAWRAPSPWSPSTPTSPTWSSAPAATPRWWSASARARTSSAPTSPRSSRYTREALELGQDQVVELRREGVTVTDFDGTPAAVRQFHVDWDAAAAEKGGYDYFMLKEIAEQPKAIADTLLGRIGLDGQLVLDEMRLSDEELREVDKVFIVVLRHQLPRRPDRQVRDRALDPHPVRGRAGREFRYRDPMLSRSTLVDRDLPVRRDDGHPDGGAARQGAALAGAGDLQHQRLDDPARVRRGALHPRRPGDRGRLDQGVPGPDRGLLPRRAVPGPGARHQVRGRDLRRR